MQSKGPQKAYNIAQTPILKIKPIGDFFKLFWSHRFLSGLLCLQWRALVTLRLSCRLSANATAWRAARTY
jgi:hypothetical protein